MMRRSPVTTTSTLGALLVSALLVHVACSSKRSQPEQSPDPGAASAQETQETQESQEQEAAPSTTELAPKVPFEGGDHRPSLARLAEGEEFDAEVFGQVDACAECHAAVVDEWRQSAHSMASLSNPIYQKAFESFLEDRGSKNTKFCAGCHDPALMLDPSIELTAAPEPYAAHLGVGCNSCHGAVEVGTGGNADYAITTAPIPVPEDGDPASLEAHLARVGDAKLRTDALCVSCHRGVLTPEMGHEVVLPGLDEWGPWRRSVYTGNQTARIDDPDIQSQGCSGCHMPKVEAPDASEAHASHRFPGGHTTLAAMIGAPDQLASVRELLEGAATVDIFELDQIPASARRERAQVVGFDVVLFNERVGHQFPGGARDLRDTWVEVVVEDARGEPVAHSGVTHARTGQEDYAYVLHARLASEDGATQREHDVSHFRTPVYDHTIAPRDAEVVRYLMELPQDFEPERLPLKVRARLRHRRLSKMIHASVCDLSRTERGQAMARQVKTHKGLEVDGCAPQPIVEIGQDVAWLGQGAEARQTDEARPAWRRHYRHGLGLLHHVQENLGEARQAFQRAQAALGEGADARHRAMVIQGLAKVSARQGRTDEAVELFMKADALAPDTPRRTTTSARPTCGCGASRRPPKPSQRPPDSNPTTGCCGAGPSRWAAPASQPARSRSPRRAWPSRAATRTCCAARCWPTDGWMCPKTGSIRPRRPSTPTSATPARRTCAICAARAMRSAEPSAPRSTRAG